MTQRRPDPAISGLSLQPRRRSRGPIELARITIKLACPMVIITLDHALDLDLDLDLKLDGISLKLDGLDLMVKHVIRTDSRYRL